MTDIVGYSVSSQEDYSHFCDMDFLITVQTNDK